MTGLRRNRVFRYQPYLQMFAEPVPVDPDDARHASDLSQNAPAAPDASTSFEE